mmetsp:Transcript_29500/g.42099  ORF Transcript_29500/g.42099 Transcript_29500/m.42099 type:complete len:180 (+) Transcript_29500:996-1535(+)
MGESLFASVNLCILLTGDFEILKFNDLNIMEESNKSRFYTDKPKGTDRTTCVPTAEIKCTSTTSFQSVDLHSKLKTERPDSPSKYSDLGIVSDTEEDNEPLYPSNFPLRKGNFYDVGDDERDIRDDGFNEQFSFDAVTDSEALDESRDRDFDPERHERFLNDFFNQQAIKMHSIRSEKK